MSSGMSACCTTELIFREILTIIVGKWDTSRHNPCPHVWVVGRRWLCVYFCHFKCDRRGVGVRFHPEVDRWPKSWSLGGYGEERKSCNGARLAPEPAVHYAKVFPSSWSTLRATFFPVYCFTHQSEGLVWASLIAFKDKY